MKNNLTKQSCSLYLYANFCGNHAFRLTEANMGHLPSLVRNRCSVGKLSTVIVLHVKLHILPHLTFDLFKWCLTLEYHGGQYRASINQVWLQTDARLESYQPLQMQGWKVINHYSLVGKISHLTFDLHMWPLTQKYNGGQHMVSSNQVWLNRCRVEKLFKVL